jgi:crossover junction endodeoxyribonuclease RuvC
MIVLGVDPGLSGALALLDNRVLVAVCDMPVMDSRVDSVTLSDVIKSWNPDEAVVEKVASMPGQGVASTFKFGMSYGAVLGVLGALQIPVRHIRPTQWKTAAHIGSDKEKARALAIDIWPHMATEMARKKDHGRAEAALIALWGDGIGI